MTTHTATASDVDVLRDLNGHYIHSVVHSDVARFTEILADDFLCTNPDGSLIDKPQFLRQTAVPVSFTDFDVDDLRIRVLGDCGDHPRQNALRVEGRAAAAADSTPMSGRSVRAAGWRSQPTSHG
jgi:hypothetical protein